MEMQLEIKEILKKFWTWKCNKLGHSFREIDILLFRIKTNALNNDMLATIKCKHCKQEFIHKDA